MDVQEETIDLSYCSTIEEFLRRYKDHGRKALCVQQALGGIEHAGIVIHDCHDGPTLSHECLGFRLTGKPSQAQIFDCMRIYDRIDARWDLSLGEVRLDTALVGARKAFAKCNRRKLTWSLSRCEIAGGAAYVRRLCLPARHAD